MKCMILSCRILQQIQITKIKIPNIIEVFKKIDINSKQLFSNLKMSEREYLYKHKIDIHRISC